MYMSEVCVDASDLYKKREAVMFFLRIWATLVLVPKADYGH